MDRKPRSRPAAKTPDVPAPDVSTPAGGVELLEDRTRPIQARHSSRRLATSLPAAIGGVFLVTALALGASFRADTRQGALVGGHATDTADASTPDSPGVGDSKDGTDGPGATDGTDGSADGTEPGATPEADGTPNSGDAANADANPEPDGTPAADGTPDADGTPAADGTPNTEPTPEPKPDTNPTPAPQPELRAISLALRLDGGKVVVDWGRCEPANFAAWKVIRSTDSSVAYPRGSNDTLVAVIESNGTTSFVDTGAPTGRALWYRVVAVALHEGKPYIACLSSAREIATPAATPETGTLGLSLALREGAPFLDWTACQADGFDAYKVVRSTDSTVRWPLGENDSLVAVIGRDGATAFRDGDAPSGKKLWYRVFCVDAAGDGYVVRAASVARAIQTPADEPTPTPQPDPVVLGFEVGQTGAAIGLDWQTCSGDGFAYYKVVRSESNEHPTYPLNDGTQLVAVIENAAASSFVDHDVAAGQTWHYRVLCFGYSGDTKVLRGITAVRSVTVE